MLQWISANPCGFTVSVPAETKTAMHEDAPAESKKMTHCADHLCSPKTLLSAAMPTGLEGIWGQPARYIALLQTLDTTGPPFFSFPACEWDWSIIRFRTSSFSKRHPAFLCTKRSYICLYLILMINCQLSCCQLGREGAWVLSRAANDDYFHYQLICWSFFYEIC